MQITRSSAEGNTATARGSAEWFTGDVYIDPVAVSPTPSRVLASLVHFMPGAYGMAPPSARTEPLRHRGDRALSAPRRTGRGHPARRPGLHRA